MYKFNISNDDFSKFKKFILDKRIISTEAEFYELPCQKKLLKHFYCLNDNKQKTLEKLIKAKKYIKIKELVYPDSLVEINHNLEGCTINKINGINLSLILSNPKININKKIYYLKQIGIVLEKMKKIRKQESYKNFFLNDLHEDNCMIDKKGKLHIIDLDSCKLEKDDWYPSKYLCQLRDSKLNKYKNYSINQETDYYCYNIIILNFLLKRKIQRLNEDEFNQYLEYLHKIGINYNLINSFSKLYMDTPNENPYKLLDTLDNRLYQANYPTFKINQKNK